MTEKIVKGVCLTKEHREERYHVWRGNVRGVPIILRPVVGWRSGKPILWRCWSEVSRNLLSERTTLSGAVDEAVAIITKGGERYARPIN